MGPLTVGPLIVGPAEAPARVSQPVSRPVSRPNPVGQVISGVQQQGGQLLERAGQVWNDQILTVRDVGSNVEVTFMDRRQGVYTQGGVRVGGAGPARVNPLQILTPGRAATEAGQLLQRGAEIGGGILRNLPPLPIWSPGGQHAH